MLRRPSSGRPEKRYEKNIRLWERSITPPQLLHGSASAFRTDRQVDVPDCFQQFCHRHPGITLAKTLLSLKPENQFQVSGFHPVIQESIITDLLKTGGEHMHEETADKLCMTECDLPFRISRFLSPRRERHFCFRNRKDAVVRNGNPVGVAPKIFDGIAKPVKSLFDIRAPVFAIQAVFETLPFHGILQGLTGGRKHKLFLTVEAVQESEIFALEFIPKDIDRKKKGRGGLPDFPVRGQPAAGDDAVHMDMVVQFLVPGVEYLDDSGLCAEIVSVSREFQECLGTALMEQTVKEPLIAVDQGIEFMGKGKHHMEIRGINDFRPALIDPEFFEYPLTVWAAAVTAGILVKLGMPAFGTPADIDTESAGFAGKDCTGGFPLLNRLKGSGEAVVLIGIQPDFLNRKVTQESHLRSGQKET